MTTEKIYYGLMILAIAVSVLASPFFYARSLRFLNRRWQDKRFKEKVAAEEFLKRINGEDATPATDTPAQNDDEHSV